METPNAAASAKCTDDESYSRGREGAGSPAAFLCFPRGSIRGLMGLAHLTGVEEIMPQAHRIAYRVEEPSEPRNKVHFVPGTALITSREMKGEL